MGNKFIFLVLILFSATGFAKPIHIVAAENFYGEIAQQIGGQYVQVSSIMNNPNQDPHLFSANIPTAKAIANARIIIYNGIDYDPWMKNLIAANRQNDDKIIIIVGKLANKQSGDNPHIWYDPNIMMIYAKNLTQQLTQLDRTHQKYYQQNLAEFKKEAKRLWAKINSLKNQYQNISIIATEPVFGYMSHQLGFSMLGSKFQISIMNNTSPSVEETKDFEDQLRSHTAKLLIYNKQVSNPITQRMQDIARQSGIPVVGISETQPVDQHYIHWMINQLDEIEKVLSSGNDRHD